MADAEALKKENAELLTKIAELKSKLGIAKTISEQDRERVHAIFSWFDRDNSGFIDRQEFDLLAFECGVPVSALEPNNLDAAFNSIDVSADGKISFEEFYAWLTTNVSGASDDTSGLQMQLQSRAWSKHFEILKGEIAKQQPSDKIIVEDNHTIQANFKLAVGDFDEAKSSVTVSVDQDAARAAKNREDCECPKKLNTFAFVDFALKEDLDEMLLGEACGMIETIMDSINLKQVPSYHSNQVTVHEADDGTMYLRLIFFSKDDLQKTLGDINIGAGPDGKQRFAGKSEVKLEAPFCFEDFRADPDKGLTPDLLKFRLNCALSIRKQFIADFRNALGSLPPRLAFHARTRLALYDFLRVFEATLKFGDVEELMKRVPDGQSYIGFAKKQAITLANTAVGASIMNMAEQLKKPASSQKQLYTAIKDTVTGLHQISIQTGDIIINATTTGLGFVQFFPDLD